MGFKITYVDTFAKELKELAKRYKRIRKDYELLLKLLSENNPQDIAMYLGKNCYKLRLKNSDNTKGKSGDYRIIYLVLKEDLTIMLLSIYAKSDYESLSEKIIDQKIMEVIHDL